MREKLGYASQGEIEKYRHSDLKGEEFFDQVYGDYVEKFNLRVMRALPKIDDKTMDFALFTQEQKREIELFFE